MVRKILAVGVSALGLVVLIYGTVAEIQSRNDREPLFETGVIIGAALIVCAVLVLGAYFLWPKSN
jgi:drug/metabolite transporter (DMT)-like permease